MKSRVLSILLAFSFVSISSSGLMSASWDNSGITGEISIPNTSNNKGLFDPLINIYNKIIDLTKKSIQSNMSSVSKSALKLLSSMASAWIVIMGLRSFITGAFFLSSFMEKMMVFVCLAILLQFSYYDKYIVSNLEILFTGLPTMFSGSSLGNNAITNIIQQTSKLSGDIWNALEEMGWGLKIPAYLIGMFGIGALTSLTLIVLINVLIATIEFYFVLSMGSPLILLYFFKYTRSFSTGALQIAFSAIGKVTCLSLFLNLLGTVIKEALVFKGEEDFLASCMGVILISTVGIVLVKVVNEMANRITGGIGQLAGAKLPHMGNLAKNLMRGGK